MELNNTVFNWPMRVYYEDTDAGGVVYHANYLCFMERARTEWLRWLGFEQNQLRTEENWIFAVRRVLVNYLAPARLDDQLQVITQLTHLGRASLKLQQQVQHCDTNATLCTGEIQIACLSSPALRPCALPEALHTRLCSHLR